MTIPGLTAMTVIKDPIIAMSELYCLLHSVGLEATKRQTADNCFATILACLAEAGIGLMQSC